MQYVNISKIPNQSFFVTVNGYEVGFRLHIFKDIQYCDISIDSTLVVGSVPCVPNGWLVPANNAKTIGGNFRFETDENEYPNYENFGDSCRFVFYETSEIE